MESGVAFPALHEVKFLRATTARARRHAIGTLTFFHSFALFRPAQIEPVFAKHATPHAVRRTLRTDRGKAPGAATDVQGAVSFRRSMVAGTAGETRNASMTEATRRRKAVGTGTLVHNALEARDRLRKSNKESLAVCEMPAHRALDAGMLSRLRTLP